MFIGKYYYKKQSSGRISLPSKLRKHVNNWIITRGLDGCLFLIPEKNFKNEIKQLSEKSYFKKSNRDLIRLMTHEAANIKTDDLGRIKIPEYLIKYANLKKEIVIVGSMSRIEIWQQKAYHKYMDELEKNAEKIAEKIDE